MGLFGKKDKEKDKKDVKKEAEPEVVKVVAQVNIDEEDEKELAAIAEGVDLDEEAEKKKKPKKVEWLNDFDCPNCGGVEYTLIDDSPKESEEDKKSKDKKKDKDEGQEKEKKNEVTRCKCKSCGRVLVKASFTANAQRDMEEIAEQALRNEKRRELAGHRNALFQLVRPECQYVNWPEIRRCSKEILSVKPTDVIGHFYLTVYEYNEKDSDLVKKLLDDEEIDGFGRLSEKTVPAQIDTLIRFMSKSGVFRSVYHHSMRTLAEKVFGATEPEICTELCGIADAAAEKENSGIFNASIGRDVYIAYADPADREAAMDLAKSLEANGEMSCFVAGRNIASGKSDAAKRADRIGAIDQSKVFVLVATRNSDDSQCPLWNCEIKRVEELDRANAKEEYSGTKYKDWDGYRDIPKAYKWLRLAYIPDNDFAYANKDARFGHFFYGFEDEIVHQGNAGGDLKTAVKNRIKALLEEYKDRSSVYCCKHCGEILQVKESVCPKCGHDEFARFDTMEEAKLRSADIKKEIEEKEKAREDSQGQAIAETLKIAQQFSEGQESQAKRLNEQDQRITNAIGILTETVKKQSEGGTTRYEPHISEKIDYAFQRFMKCDFKTAAISADTVLQNVSDHIPMRYIVAVYGAFVENTNRRNAVRLFFEETRGKAMLKEDLKLMKNMILLTASKIVKHEADALELLITSGGIQGTLAVAKILCPKCIVARESSEYLDDRLADLYKQLVHFGAEVKKPGEVSTSAAICNALIDSIRTNADSPYVRNDFYLQTKAQLFLDDYVKKIGEIVWCLPENVSGTAEIKKRYTEELNAYLVEQKSV